jgi:hypothetical protein
VKRYRDRLAVNLHGTVFQVEASATEAFTFGWLSGDSYSILQMERASDEERERIAHEIRDATTTCSRPFYCHDRERNERWLGSTMDHDLAASWRALAENQRPPATVWCEACGWIPEVSGSLRCPTCGGPLKAVMRELQLRPTAYLPRGFGPPGEGTAWWWRNYLDTGDPLSLFLVALKTQADLLSGCCLVLWRSMGLPSPVEQR